MIIGGNEHKLISSDTTIEDLEICSQCRGGCCKTKDVVIPLSDYDLGKIPKNLITILDDLPIMGRTKNGCNALTEKGCSIFDIRPFYCRTYPIKLVPVAGSRYWDSYYIAEHALVLDHCSLNDKINFKDRAKAILRELDADKIFFKRLIAFVDKYAELALGPQNYSGYMEI